MFKWVLAAAAASCVIVSPAFATQRVVVPIVPDSCKLLRAADELSESECRGPAGYSLWLDEVDQYDQVEFSRRKALRTDDTDGLSWLAGEIGIGGAVEWQTREGIPYAAIVDTWQGADDGIGAIEELLVAKAGPVRSCRVATVNAALPDAMNVARKAADTMAANFQCGRDKPIAQAGVPQVRAPVFPAQEGLDHNGSIVRLIRTAESQVEIQYELPRKGLPVTPGAVMFRGQGDNRGRLTGVAYTFKRGCESAPYQVRGEKAAGIIRLTGAAPMRDARTCQIGGYTTDSPNANLVFYEDPVLGTR